MSETNRVEKMPVLFVGHGSPMNAIEDNPWTRAFRKLLDAGRALQKDDREDTGKREATSAKGGNEFRPDNTNATGRAATILRSVLISLTNPFCTIRAIKHADMKNVTASI